MRSEPIRYSPNVEDVQPNERETIEEICETFNAILQTTAKDYGHAVRGVHAKSHGVLEGRLTIPNGLSPELAQGLFARPGAHKIFIRLSTNAGDILPDVISLPRGMALKVLGVEGPRLPDSEGDMQDFVLINGKVFDATTTKKFLGNLKLLAKTTDRLTRTKKVVSAVLRGVRSLLGKIGVTSPAVQNLGGAPNVDPLGETYYSVTPFRYGDYIAKFSVAPASRELRQMKDKPIDASGRPDAIRETVQSEMKRIDAAWDFRVQLCRNLKKQPVEDSTVEWKESEAPFETVGRIEVKAQNSWDKARVQKVDEQMRFSVWTGLEAHRPLGNINRARKAPYDHSARFRERFNNCPIHEPSVSSPEAAE